TFHGYPFKSMGRSFWEGKGFAPERVEREIERRKSEWDSILVPSEPCVQMYRTEYDYRGEILVTGYPRTDVLVDQRHAPSRSQVLTELGVDPGKTVILYAPTYRDNLTTRAYAAKRFDELHLETLMKSLGND